MKVAFEMNYGLQRYLRKEQRKRSGAWKRRKPIRILLWLALLPVFYYFLQMLLPEGEGFSQSRGTTVGDAVLYAVIVTALTWGIVILCYYLVSYQRLFLQMSKLRERLHMDDEGIVYQYRWANHSNRYNLQETKILFREIRRIVYNPFHQGVKVYAPVHFIIYKDSRSMEAKKTGVHTGEGEFLMYYENMEHFNDFMGELERRSGIPITRVDTKEDFEKERILK